MSDENIFGQVFILPGQIKVEWVELGEGYYGDYNPDDPTDTELLRLDVSFWNEQTQEWYDPGDASYCTLMDVDTKPEIRQKALERVAHICPLGATGYYKRYLQEMSWMDASWYEEKANA